MQKKFKITWETMSPSEWLNLVEFWRSVHGDVDAFYWEFPIELFGSAGWDGFNPIVFGQAEFGEATFGNYGIYEPEDGFDADDTGSGYGDGPVFLAWFDEPNLPQRYLTGYKRWRVQTTIAEVA